MCEHVSPYCCVILMLVCRWVQGNHKAEAMLLAISEAGPFKVQFFDSGNVVARNCGDKTM